MLLRNAYNFPITKIKSSMVKEDWSKIQSINLLDNRSINLDAINKSADKFENQDKYRKRNLKNKNTNKHQLIQVQY